VKALTKINALIVRAMLGASERLKASIELSRKDQGATAVEYALLVGLIAAAIILAVIFLGDTIAGIFGRVGSTISSNT
jgi:pilus assembly protein Flp/PilA